MKEQAESPALFCLNNATHQVLLIIIHKSCLAFLQSSYLAPKFNFMASKRDLKRRIKGVIYEVFDECDYIMVSSKENADAAEALIDEAADFYLEMMEKINEAKVHADYTAIRHLLAEKEEYFVDRLNELN